MRIVFNLSELKYIIGIGLVHGGRKKEERRREKEKREYRDLIAES
jgi:hypothetical protein